MAFDGGPTDEADVGGNDTLDSCILLGAASQGDRPERPVRSEEPDGGAMDSQQPEHALGDPFAHGPDVQVLTDETGNPGKLRGLVALPQELGLDPEFLDDQCHLVGQDG